MRHITLKTALIAGAALALSACGGGDSSTNADNGVGNAGLENTGDPMAVETMNNGTGDTGNAAGTGAGTGTGTGTGTPPANSGAGTGDSGTGGDTGGTDAGGDTGGNSGADVNGM